MKIQYLGHSCFRLVESTGTSIITDPYKGIGYELPKGLTADAVIGYDAGVREQAHDDRKSDEGKPTFSLTRFSELRPDPCGLRRLTG